MNSEVLHPIDHRSIMSEAREALSGNWGLAVGTFLIYIVLSSAASAFPLASLVIGGPLSLGLAIFTLNIARGRDARLENIFDGFQNFGTSLGAYLLIALAVLCGIILFIIPGIIVGIGLSQTYFILANDSEISATDAMRKSWDMMDGRKMDYFILGLRFIPYFLLAILTLFIGLLWLIPYIQVTMAKYHQGIIGSIEDEDFLNIEDHLIA